MGETVIFAVSELGDKIKAFPEGVGFCPYCGSEMIPKCGSIKIWHWSHKPTNINCLYKPETEWHLKWKEYALSKGAEIEVKIGDKIADVFIRHQKKVIELQNSQISITEILSRNVNYLPELKKIVNPFLEKTKPSVDWIFNSVEKYNENKLFLRENIRDCHLYNIRDKWLKPTIKGLFDDFGYPLFGRVIVDYNENISYLFLYKRLFKSNNRGYGEIVSRDFVFYTGIRDNINYKLFGGGLS